MSGCLPECRLVDLGTVVVQHHAMDCENLGTSSVESASTTLTCTVGGICTCGPCPTHGARP